MMDIEVFYSHFIIYFITATYLLRKRFRWRRSAWILKAYILF